MKPHVFRMALSEFREKHYIGDRRPCVNTLKRWIDDGELAGERRGGRYFVLVNAAGEPVTLDTGNREANEMLRRWQQGNA